MSRNYNNHGYETDESSHSRNRSRENFLSDQELDRYYDDGLNRHRRAHHHHSYDRDTGEEPSYYDEHSDHDNSHRGRERYFGGNEEAIGNSWRSNQRGSRLSRDAQYDERDLHDGDDFENRFQKYTGTSRRPVSDHDYDGSDGFYDDRPHQRDTYFSEKEKKISSQNPYFDKPIPKDPYQSENESVAPSEGRYDDRPVQEDPYQSNIESRRAIREYDRDIDQSSLDDQSSRNGFPGAFSYNDRDSVDGEQLVHRQQSSVVSGFDSPNLRIYDQDSNQNQNALYFNQVREQPSRNSRLGVMSQFPSHLDRERGTLRFRGSLANAIANAAIERESTYGDDNEQEEYQPRTRTEIINHLTQLRDQPWPLHRRIQRKKELNKRLGNLEGKHNKQRPLAFVVDSGSHKVKDAVNTIDPLYFVLKKIEGKHGASVVAVFNFIRAMIILNFFLALILLGGVIIPSAISVSGEIDQSYAWSSGGNCSSQPKDVCGTLKLLNDSWLTTCHENYVAKIHDTVDEHSTNGLAIIQDILQGTGFLEYTFLFSGYYPAAIENGRYIVSLAYLLTVFVTYVVSFIFVIRSVAKFLRNISSATNDYGMVFAKIVFTGWDFNIKEANAAKIANSLFVSEVRAAFDEEDYNIRSQKLTKYQRIALYLRRVLINIIILSLIGVSWAGIYFLIKEAQQNENRTALLDFIWEYAPTLTVAALNIVFPIIFGILVRFERYKGSLELFLTLSRCVLVRLISLAILIISKVGLISQQSRVCEADNEFICWETYLGQQVYSVLILDALIQLGNTLIVNVARSQLKKIDNNICKSIGAIEFNVPGHVLDVVYVQAVCWIGVLYSPLIVTGSLLYFCILFALKLFTVTFICVPATRVFRTSKSSAMFMTILAFAFFMCLVPNGLALFYLCPSLACSPFRGLGYAWQSVTYYICSLSDGAYWIRSVLFTVDETVVLIALLLVVFILAVYYIALFGARGQMIQDLEKRLKTASKDKNLLLQEYNRAQKLYAQG